MRQIGIFGGTFDPVHQGHMIVADYMAQYGGFDQVWLTLSPLNPLKAGGRQITGDNHRLAMLRHAVSAGTGRLAVCDIELTLPRPSYSYVTLDTLAAMYPDCHFTMIVGSDNWAGFERWREPARILQRHGVAVYPRPGSPVAETQPGMRIVPAPMVEISSTFVREAIAAGHDMTYFLPPGIMDYIRQHKLYGYHSTTDPLQ